MSIKRIFLLPFTAAILLFLIWALNRFLDLINSPNDMQVWLGWAGLAVITGAAVEAGRSVYRRGRKCRSSETAFKES